MILRSACASVASNAVSCRHPSGVHGIMGACLSRTHRKQEETRAPVCLETTTNEVEFDDMAAVNTRKGSIYQRAMAIMEGARILPELIVLDLDYTIWPCYCECETSPPRLYPQVIEILEACREKGLRMAVASRSPTPDLARSFLQALSLKPYFEAFEIYPSTTGNNKTAHFKSLRDKTGVAFGEMLFFDDELGNIRAAQLQGTCAVHCEDGVTLDVFHQGIENYSMRCSEEKEM